mgnify:FL=1
MPDADAIIEALGLRPHPEGGYYVETWRADAPAGERPPAAAIYYLLRAGERSHWHRVYAAEVWHYYAFGPLALSIAAASGAKPAQRHVLGAELSSCQRTQIIVPAGDWQAAETLGDWTLVGCTVSPGFDFDGFELADPDWEPGR